MDRVLLSALAQLPSRSWDVTESHVQDTTWRSPTEVTFRRTEDSIEGSSAFANWRIYFFPAGAIFVVLASLSLLCFSSKVRKWTQSCACDTNLDDPEEDGFGIPWNILIIDRPETYGPCVSNPQPVPRIRGSRQGRKVPAHLPYAPKELGNLTHRSSLTGADGMSQGSPSKTDGSGCGSSSEAIFKIEDLD